MVVTNINLRARRKAWLTVYCGEPLKQRIKDAAYAAGKSDSQFCAEILDKALRHLEEQHAPNSI